MRQGLANSGVQCAIISAILFGASTPLTKLILPHTNPILIAGILYFGSGFGLFLYKLCFQRSPIHMEKAEWIYLSCAILCGGIVAPIFYFAGLSHIAAGETSLLLNMESVFTALLAWFVFKEHFDRYLVLGMIFIVAGAWVISNLHSHAFFILNSSALEILLACLLWGLDNNLTQKISLHDTTFIAGSKGIVSGTVNIIFAICLGAHFPSTKAIFLGGIIGLFSYGISLVLFMIALRQLGTARAGAYYAIAPFFGAILSIICGEQPTWQLLFAGILMAIGVWLHLRERHEHAHTHEALTHTHYHRHDEHHQHEHAPDMNPTRWHKHEHEHPVLTHSHPHYPDLHHTHAH